jgi:hypothetical protein
MSQVTLTVPQATTLRPLVESALGSERLMIELGLRRTETNLRAFEQKYGMTSEVFYRRFSNAELDESLDFIEWAGEYKTRTLLRDRQNLLREIHVAD